MRTFVPTEAILTIDMNPFNSNGTGVRRSDKVLGPFIKTD